MSAGRACDGYAPPAVQFIVNNQRLAYARGTRKPTALCFSGASTRSLSVSIDGNDMEKQFFCSYRRATEAGVAMHSCGVSSFWTTLAPQFGHHDEAVKHALISLGASYHLYKVRKGKSNHLPDSSPAIKKLQGFIWREYNLAIKQLHGHLDHPEPQRIALVLITCLIFIALELLGGDHRNAIVHMRNGIRIITSVLDIQRLRNASSRPWMKGSSLSEADLWEIIVQFRNVEFALGGFSSDIPLMLGRQLRRDHSGFGNTSITNVAQGYEARIEYVNNIMVRCWEVRDHRGDEAFWAQQHMCREHSTLREQGRAIMCALESLWAGPQAPPPGTWLSYSSQMDWLLVNSARTLVELLPFGIDSHLQMAQTPHIQDELSRGVCFAAKMYLTHDTTERSPSNFTLETGVVGLMYWSWVYSHRPETKAAALRIIQESDQREGPWDADSSLNFISGNKEPHLLVSFWRNPHTMGPN
ncbi:C6 zinc finger domain-containing protein [Pochonia chlamydosporia 170]|uniref:C6 zinc finger domain-containing protein n=1 Tax=Pochonia chlamydosporia 170 TaxID=1380566 RepID=A0A179F0M2_METCM|nr:C6 zinc finger domain-containing protein [Pochonia chlamydosporia 170]OAQ58986.1 C6 zinc finger domain-containing protein [Pochonia chlamydosporia 170]